MARGQNIRYTYTIWCAEVVKEQIEGDLGRYSQEKMRGIQGVKRNSCCSRCTMRVFLQEAECEIVSEVVSGATTY